jgi:serine/threonine protein kinase/CRP-like cAMP-binding protein
MAIYTSPVDLTEDFIPPIYPKIAAEIKFVDEALGENFIFSSLSKEEREQLIYAMQKQEVEKDTVIIQQGDQESDYFYIIDSGQVSFIVNSSSVGSAARGGSFGELALLYNSPRAATCMASTNCTLWKVDQHTFRHLLARNARQEEEKVCGVLEKIPLFSALDRPLWLRVADALTYVKFRQNDRIITKGEEGKVFYIIQSGTVKVHDIGLGDSQFVDQVLGEGDWFGERALLTGEPRAANVTVVSEEVATLCLSRNQFEEVIGPFQTIVERGMKKLFLMSIPLFAGSKFTDLELDDIADITREVFFKKGHKIAEIGKPHQQDLWIIRHGRMLVVSEKGTIQSLLSGDYFGDKTIKAVDGRICSHEVTMEEDTTCWVLSRNELEDVIGDIDRLSNCYMPFMKSQVNMSIGLKHLQKHRILGMGAFATVWLVSHKRFNTRFAMKMLDKQQLIQRKQVICIKREKSVMQSLQHPFLLGMISSFQDEYHVYLLLPLVPGGELFNVIHSRGHTDKRDGLQNDEASFYAACIVEALGYLHVRNICYRDLKPENILIDSAGYCIVVDMGFAKLVSDKTYTLCGTPEYIAPEIILSKGHDKAVDWWSFGILVYELLVGVTPFYEKRISQSDLFKRIVRNKYEMPDVLSDPAKDLIYRLLVRKQGARLGHLSRGHRDIKDHEWFNKINFRQLVRKELPAPWVPRINNPLDLSHFDNFRHTEHDQQTPKTHSSKLEQDLFQDF